MHLANGDEELVKPWMDENGRERCRYCRLCVARGRGIHPTCRAEERSRNATSMEISDEVEGLPLLQTVMASRCRTLKHVPKAARHMWAQALMQSIATTVEENTVEATAAGTPY